MANIDADIFAAIMCEQCPDLANKQSRRRRFLATALASATILALPGCDFPTFDPNTTTLTFHRRSYSGSGRNSAQRSHSSK
jgi:hypothetical protein